MTVLQHDVSLVYEAAVNDYLSGHAHLFIPMSTWNNVTLTRQIFIKFRTWESLLKFSNILQFWLILEKNNTYTVKHVYICVDFQYNWRETVFFLRIEMRQKK